MTALDLRKMREQIAHRALVTERARRALEAPISSSAEDYVAATETIADHAECLVNEVTRLSQRPTESEIARAVMGRTVTRSVPAVMGLFPAPADGCDVPFAVSAAHLSRQRDFSEMTFGPGARLAGVLDHIRKELVEVETAPDDVTEWADVIILAFHGALRQGHEPQAILDAIEAKQTRNESRTWPDWRTQPRDRAIEHVREVVPRPSCSVHRIPDCSPLLNGCSRLTRTPVGGDDL